MKLALKIDVDTYRGTRDGVPRLIEMLKQHGAGATFLFSLGPDHTATAVAGKSALATRQILARPRRSIGHCLTARPGVATRAHG